MRWRAPPAQTEFRSRQCANGPEKIRAIPLCSGSYTPEHFFRRRRSLSQVVSKYIVETENNLDRIFTAVENSNAILLFDEADELFGKRSEVRDSHERYANIDISYLLQQMEEYQSISMPATSLRQNLDDAFVRRQQAIVKFPFPDEGYRRRIWETRIN